MIFCAVSRDVIIPPVVPVVNPVITVTEGLSMAHLYFSIYEFYIFCDAHGQPSYHYCHFRTRTVNVSFLFLNLCILEMGNMK